MTGQSPYGAPIIFWVHQLAQASRKEILQRFKQQGVNLTPEQWSILVELWKKDGQSPSTLAELTGRDRPSTSRLIESLYKQGLVDRQYGLEDRRAYRVKLTGAGRQCHEQLLPIYNDILEDSLNGIEEQRLHQVTDTLKQLFLNLNGSGKNSLPVGAKETTAQADNGVTS